MLAGGAAPISARFTPLVPVVTTFIAINRNTVNIVHVGKYWFTVVHGWVTV
jgi:hypothetical protein